jgi:nucleotide-binding universal stress UspA family protein
MTDFKNILFPVDLSESSTKIVPFVKMVAAKFRAALHLLFVVRGLQHYLGLYVPHPSIETFTSDQVKGATRKLREFQMEHMEGIGEVKLSTRVGDPAEEILRYAKENDIDLIVMGTHGRKGLDRVFFGSVAEKVVKQAPIPVLTVNPHKMRD